MQFQTIIDIPESNIKLDHSKGVVLLGSCFADNIGIKLSESKYNVLCNPFGVLYNPLSIAWQIEHCLNKAVFDSECKEIFHDGALWHSWMHHTSFSATSAEYLVQKMNEARETLYETLKTAGTLIITFGTAVIYQLKSDGRLVANCHKQKDSLFMRRMLAIDEIAERWTTLCQMLKTINPHLQLIFTVSPIRHRRDGFHQNQLSKSTLLLATDHIIQNISDWTAATYFPSYEIMMDELRDYRFYADDMIHPSSMAIEHIWNCFADTHISTTDMDIIKECREIRNTLNHRPNNPHSSAYLRLIEETKTKILELNKRYPYLNMDEERELCNTRLVK